MEKNIILSILYAVVIVLVIFFVAAMVTLGLVSKSPIQPIDRLTLFCTELAKNSATHNDSDRDVLQSCFLYLDKGIELK